MQRRIMMRLSLVLSALLLLGTGSAWADLTFSGTLFYTNFAGANNVNSVAYSYDATTQTFTLAAPNNITTSAGADGIVFDSHGNLLIGGQNFGNVYQYTTGGALLSTGSANGAAFHLALDPTGNSVYTSNFGGPLEQLALTPGLNNATQYNVVGSDTGVTQLAFLNGTAYYDTSFPNCCGNFGTIDLSTEGSGFVTTSRLVTAGEAIHGMIVDPYTGLLTFFGGSGTGLTATFDPLTSTYLQSSSISPNNCGFDQGAVDGKGHALIAGCNEITFIDYAASHDITHPNFVDVVGGFSFIDDTAPLSGTGSQTVPEPSSLLLLGAGLAMLVRRLRAS